MKISVEYGGNHSRKKLHFSLMNDRKLTDLKNNKLCFTATALAKTVLEVGEDVIVVEEVYNRAIDNVFHQLTDYTGQGDGPIITRAGFIRFLINRGDVCDLPVGRHGSRV